MLVTVVTIFPELFPGPLGFGLIGKGLENRVWELRIINIRDFATDKHKTVDDTPYGGGAGMVIKPDVTHKALLSAIAPYKSFSAVMTPKIIHMSPRGKLFSQKIVRNFVASKEFTDGMIILCGRYEGIDERVLSYWKREHGMCEISIGDYVLFGGEIAAMVVVDACLRFLPGIMHNAKSTLEESFSMDLLEYPQYTRPAVWMEESVPSVLLSGNHEKIAKWRTEQSKQITKDSRPDLWAKFCEVNCEDV